MRNITSVQSSTNIKVQFDFRVTTADQGQTFVFSNADIRDITAIDWQVPFCGGLGKSSTYSITLLSSVGWIKDNIQQLANAECFLNVLVNSDWIQPHSGKVRTITRSFEDINTIQLQIFDRFLDDDNKFPPALTDSYSILHPDVINQDIGKPFYYGLQLRPYYHTPVDCDIRTLIAPTNIDSSNAPDTSSIYYNSNLNNGFDTDNKEVSLFKNYSWDYTNSLITGSGDFQVSDFSNLDLRTWSFNASTSTILKTNSGNYKITSESYIETMSEGYFQGQTKYENSLADSGAFYSLNVEGAPDLTNVDRLAEITYTGTFENIAGGEYHFGRVSSYVNFGNVTNVETTLIVTSDETWNKFLTNRSGNYPIINTYANANKNTGGGNVELSASLSLSFHLKSEAYKNYSIYSTHQNCTQAIVSDNPIGIQSHVFSENNIAYNLEQSSASQLLLSNSNYQFNCFFAERKEISNISDDIGKESNTYIWAADSGVINFRTYQNCGDATIDATITTSDMMNLKIIDNPLGLSRFSAPKGSDFQLNFDYDFQSGLYNQAVYANKNNNSFCESASNVGLNNKLSFSSKYIVTSETANSWLNKEVKIATVAEEFVECVVPARYFTLELADIVKIQHPLIIGSESVYQITQLNHNYKNGLVKFTAQELIEI